MVACTQPAISAKEPGAAPPPREITTETTVVTPNDVTTLEQLFANAVSLQQTGRHLEAAREFDKIVLYDADGRFGRAALYQAGVSHEENGDHDAAAVRFEQLARRFPGQPDSLNALARAIRLTVFKDRFQHAGAQAQVLLERVEALGPRERIVGYSARALALLAEEDVEHAEHFISKGRQEVELHRLDSAGAIPRDLAQLYYALGEARRIRAERIPFESAEAFTRDFEQRAQLLLDAQSAYSDCMRAYDAKWTAMAGFRVGELYQKLHQAVMAVPRPIGADTPRRKQLLEGAMRLRFSILLDKGLRMIEHTLAMASRTGEESSWVTRARAVREELKLAAATEKKAVDALPFSRADLQSVLDELARRPE